MRPAGLPSLERRPGDQPGKGVRVVEEWLQPGRVAARPGVAPDGLAGRRRSAARTATRAAGLRRRRRAAAAAAAPRGRRTRSTRSASWRRAGWRRGRRCRRTRRPRRGPAAWCGRRGRRRRRPSGSGRPARPAPARARDRAPRRGRPRRRSGNRSGGDRAQVEPDVVGAVGLDAVEDRGGHLVAGSELVGEPLARRRRAASAPSPRRASVSRVPSCWSPGSASAVGWNWQNSRSASVGAGRVGEDRAGADRAPGIGGALPQRGPAPGREHRGRGCDRARRR